MALIFPKVGSNSAANNNLQGIQNGTAIAISSGSATFTLNGNQIFDWQEGISISSYTGSENQSQIINGLFINNTQSDLVLQNAQGILIQGNLFVIRTEADPFEISAGNVATQNFYSNYYWKNPDAIQVGNVYNTPYLLDDISGVSDAAPLINSTYQTIPTFTLPINVSVTAWNWTLVWDINWANYDQVDLRVFTFELNGKIVFKENYGDPSFTYILSNYELSQGNYTITLIFETDSDVPLLLPTVSQLRFPHLRLPQLLSLLRIHKLPNRQVPTPRIVIRFNLPNRLRVPAICLPSP